jgi:hypothetical protein
MTNAVKKNLLVLIGVVLGGIAGWCYWKWFGCTNGCTIKSNPYLMTIYGSVMGGLLLSFFKKNKS